MNKYTPIQYIMIQIANSFGKDKLLFEERIEWVKTNGKKLRTLADEADDKAQYIRAVLELERVLNGQKFTNLPIGLDATASGLQILSILSGCVTTGSQVGLVIPNKRCDVYTALGNHMNEYLPEDKQIVLSGTPREGQFTRSDLKQPLMTHFYFSKEQPKKVFGDNTVELIAFYKAVEQMAPGANALMHDIYGAMRKEATEYKWTLPDGHTAFTRVFVEKDFKVELEELKNRSGNSSTFTHRMNVNAPNERDVALVANVVHSVDGFLVREMQGRMNHNKKQLLKVLDVTAGCKVTNRDEMVSIYEAEHLLNGKTQYTDNTLGLLREVIESIIENPVAPMTSVHDQFNTVAPFCNQMRQYYIDICAQMTESNMIQNILRELYFNPNLRYVKEGKHLELAKAIRNSNYSIC
ncbi:DNA-directed RNA polymerase RNAP2 [Vibrio phage VCO139]|uniref:DNA-directed RNA polymerase n=1 Tax=Vibrio phage VCO139 TaxID=1283073 RepID=R9R4I2_9CAUD|nr:RNA polymerase [Vibrio phage VCO139]AGI61842.1 DNA-directed RNA polymerase RNAP2 [Vibrio phage VCO139]